MVRGPTSHERVRVIAYISVLLGINSLFAKDLFVADFTNNMQTNAGAFMAISRFLLRYWPNVAWFPWWFNGEPFENSYSPMLNVADAAFAWITRGSVSWAYNFVTASLYVLGPVFLFLFAWWTSWKLETSFFAALAYSLFSPALLLGTFRADAGGWWKPWRLRTLAFYGEGPHGAVVSLLPLMLLLLDRALRTRKYGWCAASAATAALLTLTNTFGATDLIIASGCLIAVFPPRQMPKAAVLVAVIGVVAYLWASPLLPPALLATLARDSQMVQGDFNTMRLLPAQIFLVVGFVCLWFATLGRVRDRFTRFCWLFAYVFGAITAYDAIWNIAILPQPHRYALEMELAVALAVAFTLRGLVMRLPIPVRAVAVLLCCVAAVHQVIQYREWARLNIQRIDVTQTVDYQAARWLETNLPGQRVFVGAETANWLDAFADILQMHAGHEPFNPNWVEQAATYAIYTGENAGDLDTATSVLWLKAFGCQAILVGPSRYYGDVFSDPTKFDNSLPILWHSGKYTIYAVPQVSTSLAHVLPREAVVARRPINGLDTDEVARYVSALEDPSLPSASLNWQDPSHGYLDALVRRGQVLSLQTTYDRGWRAVANGKPVKLTRDGVGLTVIHPDCDGRCSVALVFDGGVERRVCRIVSGVVSAAVLLVGIVLRRRRLNPPGRISHPPRALPVQPLLREWT